MGLPQLCKHHSPSGNHPYTRPLFDEDGPTSRVNFYVESPPSCGYRGLNVDVESLMLLSNVTARIRPLHLEPSSGRRRAYSSSTAPLPSWRFLAGGEQEHWAPSGKARRQHPFPSWRFLAGGGQEHQHFVFVHTRTYTLSHITRFT